MNKKSKDKAQADDSHQMNNQEKEPEAKKDELSELSAALEALRKEKDEIFGRLQRVSADYANFQKRVPKQIADALSYEKETFIKSVLPILDNFELTLNNASTVSNTETLVKGVKIISDQLFDILKSHGVEQITASGQKFDPALHQAVMQMSEPQKENNTVLQELQKGYKLNGRVIRSSRVVVNKYSPEPPVENHEPNNEQKADGDFETTDVSQ